MKVSCKEDLIGERLIEEFDVDITEGVHLVKRRREYQNSREVVDQVIE